MSTTVDRTACSTIVKNEPGLYRIFRESSKWAIIFLTFLFELWALDSGLLLFSQSCIVLSHSLFSTNGDTSLHAKTKAQKKSNL
jgi:hypothetical protein